MQKFKDKWEIQANWQLIFPVLGLIGLIYSGFKIGNSITKLFPLEIGSILYWSIVIILTVIATYLLLKLTLKIFKVLEKKWQVTFRWELIAIFIAFAVTGTTASKISDPIVSLLGFSRETTNGWIYWPLRIFLIFPVYQVLLIIVGWIFGQFKFFWEFEKKMLKRLGFARFIKD